MRFGWAKADMPRSTSIGQYTSLTAPAGARNRLQTTEITAWWRFRQRGANGREVSRSLVGDAYRRNAWHFRYFGIAMNIGTKCLRPMHSPVDPASTRRHRR